MTASVQEDRRTARVTERVLRVAKLTVGLADLARLDDLAYMLTEVVDNSVLLLIVAVITLIAFVLVVFFIVALSDRGGLLLPLLDFLLLFRAGDDTACDTDPEGDRVVKVLLARWLLPLERLQGASLTKFGAPRQPEEPAAVVHGHVGLDAVGHFKLLHQHLNSLAQRRDGREYDVR